MLLKCKFSIHMEWAVFVLVLCEGIYGQVAVSSMVCGSCHPKIAASYKTTGMARSFSRTSAAAIPIQSEPFFHVASETYFAVVRRGKNVFHRRWQKAADGKEVFVEELEIHHVMGSGNHALTFLHRNSKGALIELPLGWYAENGGYFAMNPGFDNPQPATRRKIDYDCMSCHNATPKIPAPNKANGAEPIYAGDLPDGIDCQRCHGNGARHVGMAKAAGIPVEGIRKSIVNPARLSVERQNEVCMQCHLETTSRRLPSMIRRFERAPFSYVPGEPLGDYVVAFDHAPGTKLDDKFEIVSAAYRLRKSQCFLKSPAMTCSTCHDPHAKRGAREAAACGTCHSEKALAAGGKHPSGNDCVGCHMPKRRTKDAIHVVMTDHLIQRRPMVGNLLAELKEPAGEEDYKGAVLPYYPVNGLDALYRAVAQVLHGSNLTSGISMLEEALRQSRPSEAEYFVSLGNAWQQAHRPEKAAGAFQEAVRVQPKSGRAWRFLGIALQESGNAIKAKEALGSAISLDPGDAVAWHQLGLMDSAEGRLKDAAAKAAKAMALDPDLFDARNSLGASLAAMGDGKAAERAFRDALQVNPYYATAHGNLARVLAKNGDSAQSLLHFAKAVKLRADFAPDRHDYALGLVRANRFADARIQIDAALALAPKSVETRILSGGLWAKDGKLDEARRDYETALQVQPDSGWAHLDLARVLLPLGDREGTISHLRAAAKSSDAASSTLARQALQNIGASLE